MHTYTNNSSIPLCKALLYAGKPPVLIDSLPVHFYTDPLLLPVALLPETLLQSPPAVWYKVIR